MVGDSLTGAEKIWIDIFEGKLHWILTYLVSLNIKILNESVWCLV